LVVENSDIIYPILSISQNYCQVVLNFLEKVTYTTVDDYFQIGLITLTGTFFDESKR
jgi:hypothetical protein